MCSRRGAFVRRRPLPRAFTLVELLVVIFIIAVLASIIIPSLGRALQAARRTQCQAHLHDIGNGMKLYVTEYRAYPGHCSAVRHGFPYAVWPTRVRRYTGMSRDVFYCTARDEGFRWPKVMGSGSGYADTEDAREWFYEVGEKLLNVHTTPFCYAYNDWGNHRAGPTQNQRGLGGDIRSMVAVNELPMSSVLVPSEMIAIGDSQQTGSWDFNLDPGNPWEYPAKVHDDGANIVFCDGHVEWGLQSYWIVPNHDTTTAEAKKMAKRWNNHNKWTND